ncbi:MAG: fibronectin type III domain-containing protein, partial [Pseudomonadota bacterium]
MTLLRNVLAGRSSSLSVPSGAAFTALNVSFTATPDGGAVQLGKLGTVGAKGPITVTSVNGSAGSVGQPVPGSTGGLVTITSDARLIFDPDGDFDALAEGASQSTLVTVEISDGTSTDDAIVTLRVAVASLPVITPPGAVSTLTAQAVGSDVTLSWSAPASNGAPITDYRIRRRLAGETAWTVISDGVSAATSTLMTGLADGTWQFSILAINAAGTGPISNIASASIASGAIPVNQTAPQLSGDPAVSAVLSYTPGVWADADTIDAALLRDGAPVAGWNGTSYTVQASDAGAAFRVRETATNSLGTAEALSQTLAIPAPFGPLEGVLDAQNVIILGASIMVDAFENVPNESVHYAEAMGFTGTLQPRATGGHDSADTLTALNAAQAEFSGSAGQNFYIVHTGGNNVSANRPYPGGAAELETDLTTLFNDIEAGGDLGVLATLTKRYYSSAPAVVIGDPSTDQNGSLPYVENVYSPLIETRLPAWFDQGAPVVDLYGLTDRYPEIIRPDGVHPWPEGERMMHQLILSRIAARARGLRNESRTGRSLVWDFGDAGDAEFLPARVNRLRMIEDGNTLPLGNVGIGGLDSRGAIDHFVEVSIHGFRGINRQGLGPDAFAKIADPRLKDFEMLEDSLFVGALSGTTVDSGTVTFRNMVPGDTVLVTLAASRDATDQNRRADVTVMGETQVLDASNGAASNQAIFGPLTVPASGEVAIRVDKRADSTFGYLGGVAVDFIDPAAAFAQADPQLKGTGVVGTVLTALPGTFLNADSVSRELLRNGSPVAGFSGLHTLQAGDAGAAFQIRETGTLGGVPTEALSNVILAQAQRPDPEAGLNLTASFPPGDLANNAFNRAAPAVLAADLDIPAQPDGLIFELGADVNGALVTFRPDGSLLLRFGDGKSATPAGPHAYLHVPAAQIPVGSATLVWQIDNGSGEIRAWIDGLAFSGTFRETPRTEWAGVNAGGYGQIGGGLVPFEPFMSGFNG